LIIIVGDEAQRVHENWFGLQGCQKSLTKQDFNGRVSQTVGVIVTFEVFKAVTIKNAVSWDIKTQFLPHRKHMTSPLLSD
jgi:hypothetical protein